MNHIPSLRLLSAALLLFIPVTGISQFLGKVVYQKTEGKQEQLEVWISAEKIRFKSTDVKSSRAQAMGLDAQEVFYDTQQKKITLLLQTKQALEVNVAELKQLLDGLQALSGRPTEPPKEIPPATVTKTKITRKIAGTEAFKMEIRPQQSAETVDLWCSEKFRYEWKRLYDVLSLAGYGTDPSSMGWMAQNYVPLRLDFRNGDKLTSWEATSVTTTVKVSDFALPAGYTPVTLQSFMQAMMMKQMMGN
jgi:hypothetical protein